MNKFELQDCHYEYNIWEAENEQEATLNYIADVLGHSGTLKDYEEYCKDLGIGSAEIKWKQV
jgi:hypothetical protein